MSRADQTTRMDWEGIALLVRWRPRYFVAELDEESRLEIGHLVIEAEGRGRLARSRRRLRCVAGAHRRPRPAQPLLTDPPVTACQGAVMVASYK